MSNPYASQLISASAIQDSEDHKILVEMFESSRYN